MLRYLKEVSVGRISLTYPLRTQFHQGNKTYRETIDVPPNILMSSLSSQNSPRFDQGLLSHQHFQRYYFLRAVSVLWHLTYPMCTNNQFHQGIHKTENLTGKQNIFLQISYLHVFNFVSKFALGLPRVLSSSKYLTP